MLLWIFMSKSLCRYVFFFFLILLGTYLGMELFSYTVTLCLTLWEIVILFIKVVTPFYIPTINVWVLIFLHPHQSSPQSMFFYHRHASGCEVVSHSGFDFCCLNAEWCWACYHVLISNLFILFGEMLIHIFCLFKN